VNLARVALVAALVLPGCRRNLPALPPPTPVDVVEIQTILDELVRAAESVRRYQGFVRIRGRGPEGGFSGRLVVVFERPHHLRVDLLGAFGSTRWSAVTSASGITVVFPGPKQYVREADSADVVGRLLGVPLSSVEVMALLAGAGAPMDGSDGHDGSAIVAHRQGSVTTVRLGDGRRIELDEEAQIALVQTSRYRASYPSPWKRRGRHVPDTIVLETDTMHATLSPEDVDVNVALASDAFVIEIPEGAERLRPSDVAGEAVFVVRQQQR